MLLFEEKVKENKERFIDAVKSYSSKLGIQPDWLMAIMNSESGFDSHISNIGCYRATGDASKCAVGLIQFMPATAKGLGTTTEKLKAMKNYDQLEYVYKYFLPYRNSLLNFMSLYLVTFYPVALKYQNNPKYIFGSEKSDKLAKLIYEGNTGMDSDGDKRISMADFQKFVFKKIPESYRMKLASSALSQYEYTAKFVGRNKG